MTTALHPTMTLEYLAYLGFNLHGKAGLHVTRRRAELRKQRVSDRNVLVCYMIGPKGAGLVRSH